MDGQFITDLIKTIVFLLPVLALVWNAAKMTGRLEAIEKDVKEKNEKYCKDLSLLEGKIEQERLATDSSISSVLATLTEIQKSIVRIETKLDISEGGK